MGYSLLFIFLFKPPSQATNSAIPKHIRKAPVAVFALYNKAKYAVCNVIKIKILITINLKTFTFLLLINLQYNQPNLLRAFLYPKRILWFYRRRPPYARYSK